MFRLEDPYALLILPLLGLIYLSYRREKGRKVYLFSSILIPLGAGEGDFRWGWVVPAFEIFSLGVMILALARPQIVSSYQKGPKKGIAILLCLDTSKSMDALDFRIGRKRVRRIDAVKEVVKDFVKGRRSESLRNKAENIRKTELEKTLSKIKHLSDKDKTAIDYLSRAIVNKLIHGPSMLLKQTEQSEIGNPVVDIIRKMFGLESDGKNNPHDL